MLSLLVKKTRMEWEAIFATDLVNIVNVLAYPLDDSTKRKNAKILNFEFQQNKEAPKQTKLLLVFVNAEKSKDTGPVTGL